MTLRILYMGNHDPRMSLVRAFLQRGHDVMWVEPFDFSYRVNGLDCIFFVPPCHTFSVASLRYHWSEGHVPKTEVCKTAVRSVTEGLQYIRRMRPRWWIMENPMGMLRTLECVQSLERRQVTFCQYAEEGTIGPRKPTDLWGEFPPKLVLRPPCKYGDPCHIYAPRGSRAGIQGRKTPAQKAEVPYQLSLDLCLAMETET